jgi:hypothetical protein
MKVLKEIKNNDRTIKCCTGIGDNLWVLQKLINANEKFNFSIAQDDPYKRATVLFDMLPSITNRVTYDNFSTDDSLKKSIHFTKPNWKDIEDKEFYLTINWHLESGKHITEFLPDLPMSYNMTSYFETSAYKKEVSTVLKDKKKKYIGIYMTSYSTLRHWNFWDANGWFDLISKLNDYNKDYVFVIIGATYDLDLAQDVMNLCNTKNISYISTIGKNLSFVTEVMKKLHFGFYFPSGIGILAASLYSPNVMFFPNHLEPMMNTFQDPELIKDNKVKHCLFCSTQDIFDWYTNHYE